MKALTITLLSGLVLGGELIAAQAISNPLSVL